MNHLTISTIQFPFSTLLLLLLTFTNANSQPAKLSNSAYIKILGIAQDGGYPQAGCNKACCKKVEADPELERYVTSLAIVDKTNDQFHLIDVSPDIKKQLNLLRDDLPNLQSISPSSIFLTHAHMGHYTGLLHFGREVMGLSNVPTYVMPRMKSFLESNAPWDQLITLKNLELKDLRSGEAIDIQFPNSNLSSQISVFPFLVPHRDEYSETVGYKIEGPNQTVLFIPDIDKWNLWEKDIIEEVKKCDVALLDATFYADGELGNRDMSKIPHPFISETMDLFKNETPETKSKIHFIHLNHTNPALDPNSKESKRIVEKGFNIAQQGGRVEI